jgi:hypothetical protein
MDGTASSSSRSSSSTSRTPRHGGVIIGSPPSVPTHLLRSKKESGSSVSSARVKKEPGSGSFTRVKKEPGSFARVKQEHDAPAPPSSKKVCRLATDAARQLAYQATDDPEEFSGQRAAKRASFNEI